MIIRKNIVNGDALTMKYPDGSEPIVFSQWSVTTGCNVKRRDFLFKELLRVGENVSDFEERKKHPIQQKTLDLETNVVESFIDQPIREYPAVHYLRLTEYD